MIERVEEHNSPRFVQWSLKKKGRDIMPSPPSLKK